MPPKQPKRLKTPKERYVAQQESYRQGPALNVEAEPRATPVKPSPTPRKDTREIPRTLVPEPVLPSQGERSAVPVAPQAPSKQVPGKTKAELMADTLGTLAPALTSFFKTQAVLGEINEKEQRTRALLGLPQTRGRGLDWGSDQGYSMGMGEADGIKAKSEFLGALKENNYFAEHADEPEKAHEKMSQLYNKISQRYTRDPSNNAYMLGMSNHLVEAKLNGEILMGDHLAEVRKTVNLENAIIKIGEGWEIETNDPISGETPESFRTRMRSVAKSVNLPDKVASKLVVQMGFDKAKALVADGDLAKAKWIVERLSARDKDGISYKDTDARSTFVKGLQEYNAAIRTQEKETSVDSKNKQKDLVESLFAHASVNNLGIGWTKENLKILVKDGRITPEVYNDYAAKLTRDELGLGKSQPKLYKQLSQKASFGQLTPEDYQAMTQALSQDILSTKDHEHLVRLNESVVNRQIAQANAAESRAIAAGNRSIAAAQREATEQRRISEQNIKHNQQFSNIYLGQLMGELQRSRRDPEKSAVIQNKISMLKNWVDSNNMLDNNSFKTDIQNLFGKVPEPKKPLDPKNLEKEVKERKVDPSDAYDSLMGATEDLRNQEVFGSSFDAPVLDDPNDPNR